MENNNKKSPLLKKRRKFNLPQDTAVSIAIPWYIWWKIFDYLSVNRTAVRFFLRDLSNIARSCKTLLSHVREYPPFKTATMIRSTLTFSDVSFSVLRCMYTNQIRDFNVLERRVGITHRVMDVPLKVQQSISKFKNSVRVKNFSARSTEYKDCFPIVSRREVVTGSFAYTLINYSSREIMYTLVTATPDSKEIEIGDMELDYEKEKYTVTIMDYAKITNRLFYGGEEDYISPEQFRQVLLDGFFIACEKKGI